MKQKTIPLTIRVPPELKARLQVIADAERRTISQLAMLALESFADEREAKKKGRPQG